RRTTTIKAFVQRMVGRSPEYLDERQQFSEQAEKIAKEISDPYRRRKALSQLRNQQAPIVDFDAVFIPDSARTVRLIAPAIAAEDVVTTGCDTRALAVVAPRTKNEQVPEGLVNLGKPFEGAAGDTVFGKDREAQKPFFWLWINRGSIVEFDPEGPPPVPPAAPMADATKGGRTR